MAARPGGPGGDEGRRSVASSALAISAAGAAQQQRRSGRDAGRRRRLFGAHRRQLDCRRRITSACASPAFQLESFLPTLLQRPRAALVERALLRSGFGEHLACRALDARYLRGARSTSALDVAGAPLQRARRTLALRERPLVLSAARRLESPRRLGVGGELATSGSMASARGVESRPSAVLSRRSNPTCANASGPR